MPELEGLPSAEDMPSVFAADGFEFASTAEGVRPVLDSIEAGLLLHKFDPEEIYKVVMACEEALVNAAKHGNQYNASKKVRLQIRLTGNIFEISIRDEGPGFDPTDVPDPTDVENIDRPCGRGLLMMRYYMQEVLYSDNGRRVFMMRELKRQDVQKVMNAAS